MKATYRSDHVGSLLRPKALVEAHVAHLEGKLDGETLKRMEDEAVRAAIHLQREAGLDVVSDGEFRRSGWAGDYAQAMEGFVPGAPPVKLEWQRDSAAPALATSKLEPDTAAKTPKTRVIGGKVRYRHSLTEDQSSFLKANAGMPYKVTLPAASYIVSRSYKPGVTDQVYGSRAEALADVAAAIRKEISDLVADGVPYIQIDNPHYPDYLMEDINAQWRALGIDTEQALREDVEADNACFEDLDLGDTVIGMHFCRGNGGALGWHSRGGYDPIAEQTFGGLKVDRLLLEYDSERAGGFEPLRFVRSDAIVVLGLVSSKTPVLEDKSVLLQRIDEASKFVPIERLALSPQCGFASVMSGNALTVDDQRRKLELVAETAAEAWR